MTKKNTIGLGLITIVASLGGFLFGFDMAVISGVLPFVEKQFALSPAQEGWFVSAALVGCIIGVAFSGELSDRLGRRRPLLLSAFLFLLSAIGCAYLPGLSLVIASRLIGGFGIGIASNVVPLYISEIAPANIRGRLVTYYQFALTFGILVAYLSNAALVNYNTNGGELFKDEIWRAMFGLGAIPAILFVLGLLIIPESPRWLISKGRISEGREIIEQISGSQTADAETTEQSAQTEGSYKEIFAPNMRRALLIGILLPLFSQFSGINAIIYYGPSILSNAGISLSNSLISQIIFGTANMLFTLVAIWKVDSWGRRPLYLWGTAGAAITLVATGFCFYFGATTSIWLLICVLAFLACFAFSIGPLKFVVASEIFPNAIRGRALAISIMTMWVADTIVGQLTPILLKGLGTAGTFWFFGFFCVVAFLVVYKLLPETKGQSLEHIENYWKEKGIDPSKEQFNNTQTPIH
ncbi:sugar porter family MFS transporter [Mucilaginibacter myungsuensis]|uniref:Sugar porter family MFS transporter n=1 Tax=Mucilaginibacter myungsuensis TaxID=649104 RepID=A0A929KSN5_9SPHI|nr:sugar porter family MFS transporter [Mucilaginibacter myungsuensis]MBE9660432.1 sugar porter family MFS transporter [Mucilaginibacter myungsuensis]MDN3600474.1 sugar porter family MFS transporter [Mucilaginibacter myungsuensis]